MKITDKRVICSNPDSVFNYFGWPTVARLPGGALALAAIFTLFLIRVWNPRKGEAKPQGEDRDC